jgi:hypothetical protein
MRGGRAGGGRVVQRHGRQRGTVSELCFTLPRALLAGAGEALKLGTGRGVGHGVSGTGEGVGDRALNHAGGSAGDDGAETLSVAAYWDGEVLIQNL